MSALKVWNSDYYEAVLALHRGGTLYVHCANRSSATLADLQFDAASHWKASPKGPVNLDQAKRPQEMGAVAPKGFLHSGSVRSHG